MREKWFAAIGGFLLLLPACGGSTDGRGAPSTGSYAFKIKWETNAKPSGADNSGEKQAASINCTSLGVDKLIAAMADSTGKIFVTGGPWACTDGRGYLTGISQNGTGIKLLVQGLDASGNVKYLGTRNTITLDNYFFSATSGHPVTVYAVTGSFTALSSASAGSSLTAFMPTVPTAPTGVSATATGKSEEVRITWTAVTGATSYKIYDSQVSPVDISASQTNMTTSASTSAVIGKRANGATYYFVVSAVNDGVEGEVSGEASAIPH